MERALVAGEHVGGGTFGQVYRARSFAVQRTVVASTACRLFSQDVALKVFSAGPEAGPSFRRELEASVAVGVDLFNCVLGDYYAVGAVGAELAARLGVEEGQVVLCGGDAVLGAWQPAQRAAGRGQVGAAAGARAVGRACPAVASRVAAAAAG